MLQVTSNFSLFIFFNNFLKCNFPFSSVIYKLLASKSEGIRVQTLKVMGYFLKHMSPK